MASADLFDVTAPLRAKLHLENGDWSVLTTAEQALVALSVLDVDMVNGGFLQFFCNNGSATFDRVRQALTHIGAVASLGHIDASYACIAPLEDDPRIVELWDLAKVLSSSALATIADNDRRYIELDEVSTRALNWAAVIGRH